MLAVVPGVNFDRAAAVYDRTRALPDGVVERVAAAIAERVGAGPATRFLEVGVGTGRILLPLVRAGHACHGVDVSPAMLDVLRSKLTVGPDRLGLVLADAMALPFVTGAFDVVLAIHVLHLVDDHQQVLAEIRRVLGPGGRVLVSRNDYTVGATATGDDTTGWRGVTRRWNAILRDLGVDRSRRPRGHWVPDEMLTAALEGLGARVERIVLAGYRDHRTPRQIAEAHRERIYSSDWETPEAIHAEAARRLLGWLDTEHAAPDAPFGEEAAFSVLLGTFPS